MRISLAIRAWGWDSTAHVPPPKSFDRSYWIELMDGHRITLTAQQAEEAFNCFVANKDFRMELPYHYNHYRYEGPFITPPST